MARIHPTAVVDPQAEIADDVQIGPYCVIEPDVQIGPGCVLDAHVVVRRFTTMGENNQVGSFSVLGQWPQDLKFSPSTRSWLRIGRGNVFREQVTLSRATSPDGESTIGDNTFWMTGSHLGHEARVDDGVILANHCAIGGHGRVGAGTFLGGHCQMHQFCWMGRRVMGQGTAGASMHVPPFVMIYSINRVSGLNRVGLRRDPQIRPEDIRQIREAFDLTYRSGLPTGKAIEKLDACSDFGPAADEFRRFVKDVYQAEPPFRRGLCPFIPERRS